jgi:hypothetical protein
MMIDKTQSITNLLTEHHKKGMIDGISSALAALEASRVTIEGHKDRSDTDTNLLSGISFSQTILRSCLVLTEQAVRKET